FPWKGTVLAVHIVRLFSIFLGSWSVFLTFALSRELFPQHAWYGLIAGAIHAFTPMFLFISSSVNNDNLIIPLCTTALLMMVKHIKYIEPSNHQASYKSYFLIGLLIAFAILTKASGLGLLPLSVAVICWQSWLHLRNLRSKLTLPTLIQQFPATLKALFLLLFPVITISGWWFVRNYRLYGDLLGMKAFYAVLGTRSIPASISQLWSERYAFAVGYWGNFGGLNIPLPEWIYTLLNGIAIVALAGLFIAFIQWLLQVDKKTPIAFGAIRDRIWPFAWDSLSAARALSWAWPAAVFISWLQWAKVTWSSQGRLVFSALSMWSLGLTIGLTTWLPNTKLAIGKKRSSIKPLVGSGLAFFLFGLSILSLPLVIMPVYRPPTLQIADPPEPYIREFGGILRLNGFEIHNDFVQPGSFLKLTLYWEALKPSTMDYSIFIHVLGEGERILAQRDSFPGHGLIPTTFLSPGMQWKETHDIALPALVYAPDIFSLGLGLYNTQTGERLPVSNKTGDYQGDLVHFGSGIITRPESIIPNEINLLFGDGIGLQGYKLNQLIFYQGQQPEIQLYWKAQAIIDDDYTVSVQLIDEEWNKAGQIDNQPMNGSVPTSTWVPGQEYVETRTIPLDPESHPGYYDLRIAIYRQIASGELVHLPVTWHKGQMPSTSVTLTPVLIQ
ncbi:MAG: hypothetical protein P1S60_16560, partial [Anaerolineae bacterium]|nr:hypothetical protein [Anaerolineae bacterium]